MLAISGCGGGLGQVGTLGGGVVESESSVDSKPTEVQSFTFQMNNKGELPIEAPVEQLPTQISEEIVPVKQPLVF